MTTPPLDLTALRADAEFSLNTDPRFPGGGYGVYLNTTVLALLDRVEELEALLKAGIEQQIQEREECRQFDWDELTTRAEAAEKKLAAVRGEAEGMWNGWIAVKPYRDSPAWEHAEGVGKSAQRINRTLDGTP